MTVLNKMVNTKFLTLIFMIVFSLQVHAEVKVMMETNFGNIELSLDDEKAPITVANFVEHANAGFYEATIFHRVISGFMIQGGGLDRDMREKRASQNIKNESNNGLSNVRGSIAMARRSHPDSATTQFYINHKDNKSLDASTGKPGYTVFGKVVSGMDVVDKIASVKTTSKYGHQNVPVDVIEILNVKVLSKEEIKEQETLNRSHLNCLERFFFNLFY